MNLTVSLSRVSMRFRTKPYFCFLFSSGPWVQRWFKSCCYSQDSMSESFIQTSLTPVGSHAPRLSLCSMSHGSPWPKASSSHHLMVAPCGLRTAETCSNQFCSHKVPFYSEFLMVIALLYTFFSLKDNLVGGYEDGSGIKRVLCCAQFSGTHTSSQPSAIPVPVVPMLTSELHGHKHVPPAQI